MDIIQVKEMFKDASFVNDIEKLEKIFEFAGDTQEVGYLGSSIVTVGGDELGNFEFNSEFVSDNDSFISVGAVLEDSIVIKQIHKSESCKKYQMYSWDLDSCGHVFFAFNSEKGMEEAYEKIKNIKENIGKKDIADRLKDLKISFEDISNIKFYDGYKDDDITIEFDEDELDDELDDYSESISINVLDI